MSPCGHPEASYAETLTWLNKRREVCLIEHGVWICETCRELAEEDQ